MLVGKVQGRTNQASLVAHEAKRVVRPWRPDEEHTMQGSQPVANPKGRSGASQW